MNPFGFSWSLLITFHSTAAPRGFIMVYSTAAESIRERTHFWTAPDPNKTALKCSCNTAWLWVNKKRIFWPLRCRQLIRFSFSLTAVWIWVALCVIRRFSAACCVVTTEELPRKCFLSACCAESAQTRPFSYYFLSVAERQKNVYQKKKRSGGQWERRQKTGG